MAVASIIGCNGIRWAMLMTPIKEHDYLLQQQVAAQTENLFDRVSEAAISEFNVNVQALVRKIAMSPNVFMSFSYLKAIGAVKQHTQVRDKTRLS